MNKYITISGIIAILIIAGTGLYLLNKKINVDTTLKVQNIKLEIAKDSCEKLIKEKDYQIAFKDSFIKVMQDSILITNKFWYAKANALNSNTAISKFQSEISKYFTSTRKVVYIRK